VREASQRTGEESKKKARASLLLQIEKEKGKRGIESSWRRIQELVLVPFLFPFALF
jgi:hypothetical protein